MSRKTDLIALQVGDEQQSDFEDPNGPTKAWLLAAQAGNYFPNQLLYVNSFFINSDAAYANFIGSAQPDATVPTRCAPTLRRSRRNGYPRYR